MCLAHGRAGRLARTFCAGVPLRLKLNSTEFGGIERA